MMLVAVLLTTLGAGVLSVWLAAGILRIGQTASGHEAKGLGEGQLLSFAAGALLGTSFLHLLPEALESQATAQDLFIALLGGLLLFFLVGKASLHLTRHEHEDELGDRSPPGTVLQGSGAWSVFVGDCVHCFGDGVLIASALIADLRLGLVAALAVVAHEVPHHLGDLIVVRQSGEHRRSALARVSRAGCVTAVGGLFGWCLVRKLDACMPYFLVLASSSFIYVALSDVIPQLKKRSATRETVAQSVGLTLGIALVSGTTTLVHIH